MKHILIQLLFVAVVVGPVLAGPIEDENLYQPPKAQRVLPNELGGLLQRAGQRPDAETRLQTLEAIRQYKMADLADTVRSLLSDERDVVQSSAIRAAQTLGLEGTAEKIATIVRQTTTKSPAERDLIATADHALGAFKFTAMTDDWLARMADRNETPTLRASAADALGVAHGDRMPAPVVKTLTETAEDADQPPLLRFAAAKAVHRHTLAQPAAVRLLTKSILDRLVGLAMVSRSPDAPALKALQANARYTEPAVQAGALRLLIGVGAKGATLELLQAVTDSPDPTVRLLAVQAAVLHQVPASVDLVFAKLNDPHPDVRAAGTKSLIALAENQALDTLIRSRLTDAVNALRNLDDAGRVERWGQAEQLAYLAAALDHKPVALGLTEFFKYPRLESAVAAIRAVRALDVAQTRPITVAYMVELIEFSKGVDAKMAALGEKAAVDAYLKYVAEQYALAEEIALTLGVWAEPSADQPLRSIIPKMHPISARVRAAGIWALGHIHAGNVPDGLGPILVSRMTDNKGLIPEADDVREQSAVALGRMMAKAQLKSLQKKYADVEDSIVMRYAARWAVGQITGQLPPEIKLDPVTIRETFIAPLIAR